MGVSLQRFECGHPRLRRAVEPVLARQTSKHHPLEVRQTGARASWQKHPAYASGTM